MYDYLPLLANVCNEIWQSGPWGEALSLWRTLFVNAAGTHVSWFSTVIWFLLNGKALQIFQFILLYFCPNQIIPRSNVRVRTRIHVLIAQTFLVGRTVLNQSILYKGIRNELLFSLILIIFCFM